MSQVSAAAAPVSDLDLARAGDDAAFTRLVGPLRRELHVHCYGMLGSTHDADDALQDALLRAWRGVARFEGRSSIRAWLYTVATRTCLDAVARRAKRAMPADLGPSSERPVVGDAPVTEIAWLGPYPTTAFADAAFPGARYEQHEALEIAFVAALQHLSGNQRAALLLVEVLGFAAAEVASMMDTSIASVNSALQRARRIVDTKIPSVSQQHTRRTLGDDRLREIVGTYSNALERGDVDALVALLTADVSWSMPPLKHWYQGLSAVTDFAEQIPLTGCGRWRHEPTSANGQPAVASYLSSGDGDSYVAFGLDVLTLRDNRIAAITTFIGSEHFPAFGLPLTLT